MESLLEVVNSSDILSLILLVLLLAWIGDRMIRQQPQFRRWGWRFAAAVFLGYSFLMGSEVDLQAPAVWVGIVCRGVLSAGLGLGVGWIALSVWGFVKSYFDRFASRSGCWREDRKRARLQRIYQREEEKRQKQWEREAPERERHWQKAEDRRLAQESAAREVRRTREDTRYACELYYNLHATKIANRFSKQELHEFLNRYMSESEPLDVIKRRTDQLVETIRQHAEAVDPPERFRSLDELTAWYVKEQAVLDSLDIAPMIKRDFGIRLRDRYTELTERLLETVKP